MPEARTNISEAYERCLAARRLWLSVRNRTAQEAPRERAHAELHESTLAWFEALVPYIAERPGEVKQLWESAPLWPEAPLTEQVWACPNGHVHERDGHPDLDGGDPCPECPALVEPTEQHVRDENGRPLYEWACGVKRLANWQDKTERQEVNGGEWSAETQVIEVPQRLDATILMRAARYLDLCAEECGLLEETDRALAVGEI
jgi:hypothetical protein